MNAQRAHRTSIETPTGDGEDIFRPMIKNFVIHKAEGWVYLYNQNTLVVKLGNTHLSVNENLQHLIVGDNKFQTLPQILKRLSSLRAIVVDGNDISWLSDDLEWRKQLRD